TPNIDRLAGRGVRFSRAFVNGAVCGSSRMSYYTGRYVISHGARWNQVPLEVTQKTMGDHLREIGVPTVLVGKTHMRADEEARSRLAIPVNSPEWLFLSECGFSPEEHDDGLHPDLRVQTDLPYNEFLRSHGFDDANPWHTAANSVIDEKGELCSGWLLRSAPFPAIVPDELSETAYMTDRAIDFIRKAGDDRWCLHLSFIKPHWPYVVSDPYHLMYADEEMPRSNRTEAELETTHPVIRGFHKSRIGKAMSRPETRRLVLPTYLGLVKQIDDHLGRLFAEMDRLGRSDDTMIVFTSDHGEYMGDHWMGEKDWINEEVVRVPMIVVDPRPQADPTRGTVTDDLVEAIDLLPTFVEALGGENESRSQWLEGKSLMPIIHDQVAPERDFVVCEADWGFLEMAHHVTNVDGPRQQRATMIRNERYKYVLSEVGPNLLYDLQEDPDEQHEKCGDPSVQSVVTDLHEQLFSWFRSRRHDTTFSDEWMSATSEPGGTVRRGIPIGYWDEEELAAGMRGELY
ncbi:MAG: sulfatase-like hydrolase/transferase, partial [Actinomycetota bacterium]|nr:sulfatase-like hydrolase/transferase [Actinomycetota bacterium]